MQVFRNFDTCHQEVSVAFSQLTWWPRMFKEQNSQWRLIWTAPVRRHLQIFIQRCCSPEIWLPLPCGRTAVVRFRKSVTPDGCCRLHSWPPKWSSKNQEAVWNLEDYAYASSLQGCNFTVHLLHTAYRVYY